ncbi:MAG: divalent-cation tolerance protein CutA [Thermoplasmata archaeon]|nr:divalent-cation tolerance protein CutA [Thermoplasmata archaeon]
MTPYPMDPVDATGPVRIVLCTFPNREAAERLVRAALEARLVACANLVPVASRYWWKGRIQVGDEVLVFFKTVPKRVGALFRHLSGGHPYEVPEILEVDVARANVAYLTYLAETIDPDAPPLPLGGGRPHRRAPTRSGSRRAPGVRRPGRTPARRRRR